MNTPRRFALIACVVSLAMLVFGIPFVGMRSAAAQGFGRGPGGGEGRSGWRGNRGGEGGGGGRDLRERGREGGGDRRAGDRRGDDRSDDKPSFSTPAPSSTTKSATESKPADPAAEMAKTKSWAEGVMKEHDKDKDHFLKGDEIKGLGSSSAKYDLDNDRVITVDELITKASSAASPTIATPSAGESTGSNSGGDSDRHRRGDRKGDSESAQRVYTGSAGGLASKSKEGDKRHSYRFSTAADRLPTGLPSFFSRDKNGDGQISMSEYSRTWSKSIVGEFRKYDANDDGIITAKEAVKPTSGG